MLRGKSRIAMLAASGVIAALMVGSIVVASNMGFKARFTLDRSVSNWFSPPYTSPYVTADDLLDACCLTGGEILRTIPTSPVTYQSWNGSQGTGVPQNFVLKPGEGYDIKPTLDADFIIVGAHDPFVTVPAGQDDVNTAGDDIPPGFIPLVPYLFAVPYHTTYQFADDVLQDMPGCDVGTPCRIDKKEQTLGQFAVYSSWNGGFGTGIPQNFPIILGKAYEIRLASTGAGFTPAHF